MPARRSVRITLGVSGRIGSSSTRAPATRPSIETITQDERFHRAPATDLASLRRERLPLRDPGGLPERHAPAFDRAADAGAGLLPDTLGERELEAPVARRRHDRRGEHVRRRLVE